MKTLGSMTSGFVSIFILSGLFLLTIQACRPATARLIPQMVCQHPAINEGMPMVMPNNARVDTHGVLTATNNGTTIYLTGHVCATAVREDN